METSSWNTKADGTGTSINWYQSFSTGSDLAKALGVDLSKGSQIVTLYAEWKPIQLRVIYNSNGADTIKWKGESLSEQTLSGMAHIINSTEEMEDGLIDGNNPNTIYLEKNGYKLETTSWNTKADGTGTSVNWYQSFASGNDLAKALGVDLSKGSQTVTLYAEWKPNTYAFTMNSNGGSGNMSGFNATYGVDFAIPTNTFTEAGYTFSGWNVKRNQDNKWYVGNKGWFTESEIMANGYRKCLYPDNSKYTFNEYWTDGFNGISSYTFYAMWSAKEYTVSFDANGGSVSTGSMPVTYNSNYGELPTLTRNGYTFDGWFSAASGGTQVTSDTIVTTAANHKLYAHWTEKTTPVQTGMTVSIDSVQAAPGSTITVPITISQNPGIASLKLLVEYDSSVLKLQSAEINPAYKDISGVITSVNTDKNPAVLLWVNPTAETRANGTFATLTFAVAANADGKEAALTITYDEDDIYNASEVNVPLTVQNGKVVVTAHQPGDINNDGKVNNKDLTRLAQHLAGKEVEVIEDALDVNGDGKVNNKDLTRLAQYLAGKDVEIY